MPSKSDGLNFHGKGACRAYNGQHGGGVKVTLQSVILNELKIYLQISVKSFESYDT